MTPTRQERKEAIEVVLDSANDLCNDGGSYHGTPAHSYHEHADIKKAVAVLRAMLENFDEREDFLEAANAVAEAYVRVANTDEYGPKLMAMVTLYRRKIGQRDVPGEVRIAGRRLVEKDGK